MGDKVEVKLTSPVVRDGYANAQYAALGNRIVKVIEDRCYVLCWDGSLEMDPKWLEVEEAESGRTGRF